MSRRINQSQCDWEAALAMLRRTETAWRGVPLSRLDHLTYTEAILLWGMVLSDLSSRCPGLGSFADHVKMMHCLASSDVADVATFLSEVITLWRHMSVPSRVVTYNGFKRRCLKVFPRAGEILGPMKGAIVAHLSRPSSESFYPVYQVFSFLNHLELKDLDMGPELEREYLEQEDALARHTAPAWLTSSLNRIMRSWMRGFRIDEQSFVPSHGPGGVAELSGDRTKLSKYRLIQPDPVVTYVLRKHIGVDADSYAPCRDASRRTIRRSTIVFVPKSMKTKRVISKEPATLLYFQQGVDRCLRKMMAMHPYLSRRIDLSDQAVQGEMACDASRTGLFATVDLSAASDSISLDLVRKVFAGTPILSLLVGLRSRSAILPSGTEVGMAKFAPMGSSMTFPIQTLIFAAVCELTVNYVHPAYEPADRRYRVYGDDIIIPADCLADLESNLHLCGFRMNASKTYGYPYKFRESCGTDAYDGVVVTPMRIGRKFSAEGITAFTPGVFAGLVDMANQALDYEFLQLRRYLVRKLLTNRVGPPLFSETADRGVRTPSPTNFRVPRRYNEDIFVEEVYVADTETATSSDGSPLQWNPKHKRYDTCGAAPLDAGSVGLCEWFLSTLRSPDDPLGPALGLLKEPVHIGSSRSFLSRQWRYDPLYR